MLPTGGIWILNKITKKLFFLRDSQYFLYLPTKSQKSMFFVILLTKSSKYQLFRINFFLN